MAHFGVKRFLEEPVPKQGAEILEQLRLEAKKRKELRNKKVEKVKKRDKDDSQLQSSTTHKSQKETLKTKKKSKRGVDESESIGCDGNNRLVDESAIQNVPKKSNKRKRDEVNEEVVAKSEIIDNELPKKKKKKKKEEEVEMDGELKTQPDNNVSVALEVNETHYNHQTSSKLHKVKNKTKSEMIHNKKLKEKKKNLKPQPNIDSSMVFEDTESQEQHNDIEDEASDNQDFAVIGEVIEEKREKVKRIIPDWLARPTIISADLKKNLSDISELKGLHPSLISLLEKNGVKCLFPVQSTVIPYVLESLHKSSWLRPRDICVSAPTGSGKTLAYALPIIQALYGRTVCNVKALIVLPVVDLATQVYKVFKTYIKDSGLQVGLANGQSSLSVEQASLVRKGFRRYHSLVDILVCTPGRLVDHINSTPGFSLHSLRFLVIDEADRMMQQIKQGWLNCVERSLNEGNDNLSNVPFTVASMDKLKHLPQKLLFSATLSYNPEKLKELNLFQPHLFTSVVDVDELRDYKVASNEITDSVFGKYTTPKELKECYVVCDTPTKPLVLLHFICNIKYKHILCFTNSVETSHRLSLLLSAYGDVTAAEFSSKLKNRQRDNILKKFSQGLIDVIVCSDALARGMDVKNVDYVISYDMPPYLKTYIHRVGRTARAGRPGTAISFLRSHEVSNFKSMLSVAKKTELMRLNVEQSALEPMEERFRSALKKVADSVAEKSTKTAYVQMYH